MEKYILQNIVAPLLVRCLVAFFMEKIVINRERCNELSRLQKADDGFCKIKTVNFVK